MKGLVGGATTVSGSLLNVCGRGTHKGGGISVSSVATEESPKRRCLGDAITIVTPVISPPMPPMEVHPFAGLVAPALVPIGFHS
eukprot:scaffold620_cov386-Prasinococcus_capsulatus_cf.AAC.2